LDFKFFKRKEWVYEVFVVAKAVHPETTYTFAVEELPASFSNVF